MKDPLNPNETPFEVLNVNCDVDSAEINAAFKRALLRGAGSQAAEARNILRDPVERALVQLLDYDDDFLVQMNPNPIDDPLLLQDEERQQTATRWQRRFKSSHLADEKSAHSLAVLWYWSGMAADEFCENGGAEMLPDAMAEAWQKAIAFWTYLMTSTTFLENRRISDETARRLRRRVLADISSHFHDKCMMHQQNGNTELAEAYRKLELDLEIEKRAAATLFRSGVRLAGSSSKLSCGVLMLSSTGLLKTVRTAVSSAVNSNPDSGTLERLAVFLSPHSAISTLVSEKRFDEAIAVIESMPPDQQQVTEVVNLRTRALLGRGNDKASVGEMTEAMDCWRTALKCTKDRVLSREIKDTVVQTSLEKATAMERSNHRDSAINILEEALKVVENKKLSDTLAQYLCNRGIARVNRGQDGKGVDNDNSDSFEAIRLGEEDLHKAYKLNPHDERIKDSWETAKKILADARVTTAVNRDPQAKEAYDRAQRAAEANKLDEAIKILEIALPNVDASARKALGKKLAEFYGQRARLYAEEATDILSNKEEIEQRIEAIAILRRDRGIDFGQESIYGAPPCDLGHGSANYSITYDGVKVNLCQSCVNSAQRARDQRVNKGGKLLCQAATDLEDQVELDPDDKVARTNLSTVKEMLSDIDVTFNRTRGRRKQPKVRKPKVAKAKKTATKPVQRKRSRKVGAKASTTPAASPSAEPSANATPVEIQRELALRTFFFIVGVGLVIGAYELVIRSDWLWLAAAPMGFIALIILDTCLRQGGCNCPHCGQYKSVYFKSQEHTCSKCKKNFKAARK